MEFRMRRSRVLKKLRAGEVVNCYKINVSDTRVMEIAARFGFDCLWVGMEHIATDWSVVERAVLATKCYDTDLLCRVARGSYSDYIRPLELDATGIMVPHVMGIEDAKDVVRMTRFPPVGKRPVDGGNADGFYCNVPLVEYFEQANRERFIILQIEDPEPMEELEAIADLPGYDMLLFGAGDYSCAMGYPKQFDHPVVVQARKRIAEVAIEYGKSAGILAGSSKRQEYIDMGYTFVNVGADVVSLSQSLGELTEACGIKTSNEPVSICGDRGQ